MTSSPWIPRVTPSRFRRQLFARNGLTLSPIGMVNQIAAANHILKHRRKSFVSQVFYAPPPSGGGSETARFRYRFLTGASATHVYIRALYWNTDSNTPSSYGRFDLKKQGGGTTTEYIEVEPVEFTTASDDIDLREYDLLIACDPESVYELLIYERNTRLCAISVSDYCDGDPVDAISYNEMSIGGSIVNDARVSLASVINKIYKYNQSHLFSWAHDLFDIDAPIAQSTIDYMFPQSTDAADGSDKFEHWFDLTNVARRSKTTVPVTWWAYAYNSGAGTSELYLRDGATVKATITVNSTTPQWWSTTVDLDASAIAYNFAHKTVTATNCTTEALSLYIYDP